VSVAISFASVTAIVAFGSSLTTVSIAALHALETVAGAVEAVVGVDVLFLPEEHPATTASQTTSATSTRFFTLLPPSRRVKVSDQDSFSRAS